MLISGIRSTNCRQMSSPYLIVHKDPTEALLKTKATQKPKEILMKRCTHFIVRRPIITHKAPRTHVRFRHRQRTQRRVGACTKVPSLFRSPVLVVRLVRGRVERVPSVPLMDTYIFTYETFASSERVLLLPKNNNNRASRAVLSLYVPYIDFSLIS